MTTRENPSTADKGARRFRYLVQETWAKFPANGEFGEAVAVACDSQDRVYVFLRGPRPVQIFTPDGSPVDGWGEGVFVRPHGIFIGPDDTVYCTDDFDHTIRAFTRDGQPRFTLGTSGRPSATGATSMDYRTIQHAGPPFNYPTNLALGPAGDIYVADGYGNARVHRFGRRPAVALLGRAGQQARTISCSARHRGGRRWHGLCGRPREQPHPALYATGEYLGEWTDVARPCQLYIDRAGWIYVAELGFRAGRWPGTGDAKPEETGGRVSMFDRQGNLQTRWGGGDDPCAAGDFYVPHGIWVDSRGDLYVAEVTLSGGARAGLGARLLPHFSEIRAPIRRSWLTRRMRRQAGTSSQSLSTCAIGCWPRRRCCGVIGLHRPRLKYIVG